MSGAGRHPPEIARFWHRVDVVNWGDCWKWIGSSNPGGYGEFTAYGKRHYKAHRYSYEIHGGVLELGMQIDHLCRNRWCVNPEHLEQVTQKENILRGVSPAASHALKGKCPKGHDYSHYTGGRQKTHRICRTCQNQRSASIRSGEYEPKRTYNKRSK